MLFYVQLSHDSTHPGVTAKMYVKHDTTPRYSLAMIFVAKLYQGYILAYENHSKTYIGGMFWHVKIVVTLYQGTVLL